MYSRVFVEEKKSRLLQSVLLERIHGPEIYSYTPSEQKCETLCVKGCVCFGFEGLRCMCVLRQSLFLPLYYIYVICILCLCSCRLFNRKSVHETELSQIEKYQQQQQQPNNQVTCLHEYEAPWSLGVTVKAIVDLTSLASSSMVTAGWKRRRSVAAPPAVLDDNDVK